MKVTSPALAPASDQRLVGVDVLRGIAALAVVAIHIPHYAHGGWREHPFFWFAFLFDYGYLGVSLFVVISGFCIHRGAALAEVRNGRLSLNWPKFWKRRFWRLYPPYLVAIGFSLTCAALLHDRFTFDRRSLPGDFATHLLLIHNLTENWAMSLANGAFWSLGMEEQLYLLYFPLFLLLARWSRRRAIAVVALTAVGWRLALSILPADGFAVGGIRLGSWGQWPFHYWLHWALGALAVDAYLGNVRLPQWCRSKRWALCWALLGLLFNFHMFELLSKAQTLAGLRKRVGWLQADSSLLGSAHFLGELAFAVAFFCLLNCVLQHEAQGGFRRPAWRGLAAVGRFSYSLYLTHVPVIYALEKWVPFGDEPWEWLARYVVYGVATLAMGLLFYRLVESWFLSPTTLAVADAASAIERQGVDCGMMVEPSPGTTRPC